MQETVATVSPIPTRASKPAISAFAEKLATSLSFEPGDLLDPVVARLGGQVVYHDPSTFQGTAPESIRVSSKSSFTIYIPSTTSLERDRFTIAHELGHLFLHYPMIQASSPNACMVATRWVDESDQEQRRAEWEANWFAAAFLMPAAVFKAEHRRAGGFIASVASMFGVSVPAAEIRAKNLGL